jgi:hypothetical protein
MDVDSETEIRWRDAFQLMRAADDIVDSVALGTLPDIAEITASIEMNFSSLSRDNLGRERYIDLVDTATRIIGLGEALKAASNSNEYLAVRHIEAIETAHVVSHLATDFFRDQPQFAAFEEMLESMAIGAGLWDTALDAKRDYHEKTLSFPPSVGFRLRLLTTGAYELLPVIPTLPHRKVVAAIGKLGYRAYKSGQLKRHSLNNSQLK